MTSYDPMAENQLDQVGSSDIDKGFVYPPIDEEKPSTRLLTLYPGGKNDPLRGTLSTYRLDSRLPSYIAISYCWGDVGLTDSIIEIDDQTFRATLNAYNTLVNNRSTRRNVRVWIDHICINQADLDEKSRCVRHMGEIFRRADAVIIHLGEKFDGSDTLFDYMCLLDYSHFSYTAWWKKWVLMPLHARSPFRDITSAKDKFFPWTVWKLKAFEDKVDDLIKALLELLKRPWFTRLWVIQEAVVARRLYVQLGDRAIRWNGFSRVTRQIPYAVHRIGLLPITSAHGMKSVMAIELLVDSRRYHRYSWTNVIKGMWRAVVKNRGIPNWQLFEDLRAAVFQDKDSPVLPLLREFRHQNTTLRSDKLFALMGLVNPKTVRSFLSNNDYSTAFHGLCFYFAVMNIFESGNLDVLSASCFGATALEVLPRWCPDWSNETPLCDTKYGLPTYDDPPHQTGLRKKARVDFVKNSNWALILQGMEFDVVESIVEGSITIANFKNPLDDVWVAWKAFGADSLATSPYETDDDRWDAFWRVLVYNHDGGGNYAPTSLGDTIREFLNNELEDPLDATGRIVFKGRRLYRTRRGYLGNGCDQVRPGDKIYVFDGGRFPFILREAEPINGTIAGMDPQWAGMEISMMGHDLIGGDTYIHGLADGEAYDIAQTENITTTMVCMR